VATHASSMRRRIALSALVLVAAAAAVVLMREPILRLAGGWLVRADPLQHADVIVIATDANGSGALEATDLVRAGFAPRVAVFSGLPDPVEQEFIRRGAPYFNSAATAIRQLHSLGVTATEVIPQPVGGTNDEGHSLPPWCAAHGYHRVIFVSTPDHSRRTRRVLRRATQGAPIDVIVVYAHYSDFNPDSWWSSRGGTRIWIVESQKLMLDLIRHPF